MPSTTSSSVSRLLASSTVMTPSLPTFFIASARKRPISASPLDEMVPTWAISSFEVTFLELVLRCSTTASTALSTPRLRSIGFMPAATDLAPSLTIAWARTVAVVVPSPATSEVLEATSRSICAPIFSNLSSSSISLATVTPSLVTRGAPKDFPSTTLRPLGPKVTLTALARVSTPCSIFSRASALNFTSLADMSDPRCSASCDGLSEREREREQRAQGKNRSDRADLARARPCALALHGALNPPHDVVFLHDQQVLPVDLDLGAGPFAEQDLIAGFDVDSHQLAGLVALAGAHRQYFALLRFFLGRIGNDDAAGRLLFGIDAADHDAVMQGPKLHVQPPFCALTTSAQWKRYATQSFRSGRRFRWAFGTFKRRVL